MGRSPASCRSDTAVKTGDIKIDGDFSDWLEIHNPDATSFNLSGCYLTDDPALLTQWQFPANTQIGAGSFLIVFASDKDRSVTGSELHTNFKLEIECAFAQAQLSLEQMS